MKQYGDITKLSGHDLEPVDLIVGGSPCQNLSIAGNRQGLAGSESGLFLEMIRIIREMREETNGEYPKYALWENVPGATSSNSGRDFGTVLGEFSRLIEPNAPDVPVPQEGWKYSGVLLVNGRGSLAYRTHDAQYWGVPQRRRRLSLITDFRGQSSIEILFERKGLSGNSEQSEAQGKGFAESIRRSTEKADGNQVNAVFDSQVYHGCKEFADGISQTVNAQYGTGGNNQPLVVATMQGFGDYVESDTASACKQRDYKDATDLVCRIRDIECYTESSFGGYADGFGCLRASKAGAETIVTGNKCQENKGYVRRLTPLECERLQGYPDGWSDIPRASDSSRYKALGSSIALPFWEFLAKRFVEIGEVKSIGSLFDGIGGFPLVFKRAGAETKWTSEIEPFCQKVVKYHLDKGDL